MARRTAGRLGRRPALHPEAAAGRHVLRRPAADGRRCGVLVRAVYDAEGRRVRSAMRCRSAARSSRSTAVDAQHGRRLTFPIAFAPGVPHARQPADSAEAQARARRSRAGTFARAGALSTPPSELAGARSVRADGIRARDSGWSSTATRAICARRPTAPRCRTWIASPSRSCRIQNAELLRLEAGQIDMTTSEIRARVVRRR